MLFYYKPGYWNCLVDIFWFNKESVSVNHGKSTKNGQKLPKLAIFCMISTFFVLSNHVGDFSPI